MYSRTGILLIRWSRRIHIHAADDVTLLNMDSLLRGVHILFAHTLTEAGQEEVVVMSPSSGDRLFLSTRTRLLTQKKRVPLLCSQHGAQRRVTCICRIKKKRDLYCTCLIGDVKRTRKKTPKAGSLVVPLAAPTCSRSLQR